MGRHLRNSPQPLDLAPVLRIPRHPRRTQERLLCANFRVKMTVDSIKLYRMTHIANIPHVLQYGIVHSSSPNRNPHYVSIGDKTLIDFRRTKKILITPERNIILGDFIPFYFGVRMPMLFVMQKGGNFVEKAYNPEEIVYVAISLKKIIDMGYLFYFSNGHATDYLTSFYTPDKVGSIPELLDWDAIKAHQWSGEGIETDLKRRKQAEFLVKQDVAAECIYGYVCYNDNAKARLLAMGVPENMIKIFPNAYY